MQCPSCNAEISTPHRFCPRCGAPLSGEAPAALPAGLASLAGLGPQAGLGASLMGALAAPDEALPAEPESEDAADEAPLAQPATVAAPQPRAQPVHAMPSGTRALYFDFNEKPANIVRVMDDARKRRSDFLQQRSRRKKLLLLLFPAGLPFLAADLLLGYNVCTFSLVAGALWLAAVAGLLMLAFNRAGSDQFGSKYEAVRTLFATVKDDISPKRTLTGWLDLTGMEQPGKVVRESTAASGMPIKVFRDEWLRLKMSLYDGSLLRVSAFESSKKKMGRYKRGGSGKSKWRAGGTVWARNEVQVAITADPQAYEVQPVTRVQVGMFSVDASRSDSSRVILVARTSGTVGASDILSLLRFAHDHLKPRQSAATASTTAPAAAAPAAAQ